MLSRYRTLQLGLNTFNTAAPTTPPDKPTIVLTKKKKQQIITKYLLSLPL